MKKPDRYSVGIALKCVGGCYQQKEEISTGSKGIFKYSLAVVRQPRLDKAPEAG